MVVIQKCTSIQRPIFHECPRFTLHMLKLQNLSILQYYVLLTEGYFRDFVPSVPLEAVGLLKGKQSLNTDDFMINPNWS